MRESQKLAVGKAKGWRRGMYALLAVLVVCAAAAALILANMVPQASASDTTLTDAYLQGLEKPSSTDGNLTMGQKADVGQDGRTVTVTSSQYAKGGIGDGKAIGTDVVLVLDLSTSMNDNNGIGALRIAVSNYLDEVAAQSAANQSHGAVPNRVSIVLFSGAGSQSTADFPPAFNLDSFGDLSASDPSLMTNSANVSSLKAQVNKLVTCGGTQESLCHSDNNYIKGHGPYTQTNEGLKLAYQQMQNSAASQARQVVVFTDGVPGAVQNSLKGWVDAGCGASGGCQQMEDPEVEANEAIEYANKLKKEFNATIYSAAMIQKGQQNPDWDTAAFKNDTTWTTATLPAASVATQNPDTKRFIELMSSNVDFKNADGASMSSVKGTDWTLNTADDTGTGGYALFASQPSELGDLFSNMIPKVDKAAIGLDDKAQVSSYVTDDFALPATDSGGIDMSGVKVYEEKATAVAADGTPTFDGNIVPAQGTVVKVVKDADGHNGIQVSGWNFATNYVGQHTDGSFGKRLIIQYSETAVRTAKTDGPVAVAAPASSISEPSGSGTSFSAPYVVPTVQLIALADNSWIPTCTVSNGLCLGKSAKMASDNKTVTITLSAYATGSVSNGADSPANSTLTAESQIADFASAYFSTTRQPSDVTVWEQAATSVNGDTANFDKEAVQLTSGYTATALGDKGDDGYGISDWPIAKNYVGEHTDSATSGNYGKRIIIQFTEQVKPAFLGGNGVPTNVQAISGVTGGVASGTGATYAATFPKTGVDVPVAKDVLKTSDARAYETGTFDLSRVVRTKDGAALSFTPTADGSRMNDFVNINVTFMKGMNDGVTVPTAYALWSLDHDNKENFTPLDYSADASLVGTKDQSVQAIANVDVVGGTSVPLPSLDTVTIYALTPHVSVKDSEGSLGSSVDLHSNVTGWKWWNDTKDSDLASLPLASNTVTGRSGTDGAAEDVTFACVQGECPTVESNKVALTTSSDFKVSGVNLTAGTGEDAAETTAAAPDGVTVSSDRTTVSESDRAAAVKADGVSLPSPDGDFTVYALGSMVSSLPFAGADATGRGILLLALGLGLLTLLTVGVYKAMVRSTETQS